MASYNRIILIGNLTRDPQMSYLPNQTPVTEFSLAVNHRFRDGQGNNREDVCFIDCRVFGKSAETANQYLSKGKQVLVEGRLTQSRWEAKDGTKQSKHRVMVDKFQFLGAPSGQSAPNQASRQPTRPQAQDEPDDYGMEEPPMTGEDIPF